MEERKWPRQLRCTDTEWDAIAQAAERAGLSRAEWIRQAIAEKLEEKE